MSIRDRIRRLKGTPWEAGFALGRALGAQLERNIAQYIENGPAKKGRINVAKLRDGALPWLRNLPRRFREEFEGLAEGAGIPMQRLAEWCFVEECVEAGCSALLCRIAGNVWVARNNDYCAPGMWGYVTIREIDGRIPTIGFGLEGELFTGTGINRERLWLHYNWLPVRDTPATGKPHWAPFVWMTEALETCCTLNDVEALLGAAHRDGGMMLFAVDGKTDSAAVFECACAMHARQTLTGDWLAGTNHYVTAIGAHDALPKQSQARLERIEALLRGLWGQGEAVDVPGALVRILADPDVEARGEHYGTVYANVACPNRDALWYTFGGYPAASAGVWDRLEWPW